MVIANNLTDFVIKPCVSGAARETYHIKIEDVDNHEANFKKLIRQEAMMLQPFQYSVPVKGEVSYMVMNGKFTHAILKKAKPGDFRVQDDFGGTVHDHFGIEQGFVEESTVCASQNIDLMTREQILNSLKELNISCKNVAFRIFGLSLTTYNLFASVLMLIMSLKILSLTNNHDIKK